jgi:hypothetical protein
MKTQKPSTKTPLERGLEYARWGGYLFSTLLLLLAFVEFRSLSSASPWFPYFKLFYFCVLAVWVQLPYNKLIGSAWRICYGALILLSIGFVFLMIVVVMFAYIESAERGERLGVPGFQGTLIFLCLLQAPTILFRRNPDLLDE